MPWHKTQTIHRQIAAVHLESLRLTLRHLRETRGLRQADVAKAIGVTRSSYTNWETGYAYPTLLDFIALCSFYTISTQDAIGWSLPTDQQS